MIISRTTTGRPTPLRDREDFFRMNVFHPGTIPGFLACDSLAGGDAAKRGSLSGKINSVGRARMWGRGSPTRGVYLTLYGVHVQYLGRHVGGRPPAPIARATLPPAPFRSITLGSSPDSTFD